MNRTKEIETLAHMKYGRETSKLAAEFQKQRQRVEQTSPRGGAREGQLRRIKSEQTAKYNKVWIDSWLGAFESAGVVPDEDDLRYLLENFKRHMGARPDGHLQAEQMASAGFLRDLEIRTREMMMRGAKAQAVSAHVYQTKVETLIGGLQVGGEYNTQNVEVNLDLRANFQKLTSLIHESDLSADQKISAIGDLRTLWQLSQLERNERVQNQANSRLTAIEQIISLSANLVGLGMPIIQIVRTAFGV